MMALGTLTPAISAMVPAADYLWLDWANPFMVYENHLHLNRPLDNVFITKNPQRRATMGKKKTKQKKVIAEINADLEQIHKWARKRAKGSDKDHHAIAAECLQILRKKGCKTSCCGKPPDKLCKGCPRVLRDRAEVAPLWHALAS